VRSHLEAKLNAQFKDLELAIQGSLADTIKVCLEELSEKYSKDKTTADLQKPDEKPPLHSFHVNHGPRTSVKYGNGHHVSQFQQLNSHEMDITQFFRRQESSSLLQPMTVFDEARYSDDEKKFIHPLPFDHRSNAVPKAPSSQSCFCTPATCVHGFFGGPIQSLPTSAFQLAPRIDELEDGHERNATLGTWDIDEFINYNGK
jgi:hypothetical protein